MYNKKSKISAVLAVITALLLIGFMIMLPLLQYKVPEGDEAGNAIGIGFALLIVIAYGYPLVYASSIPFALVGLIFGIKMLRQQSRKKLISLNVRMLITSIVLLPFLTVGLMLTSSISFHSTLGLFPVIYVVVLALAYILGIISQIVAIILLKKSPAEDVQTVIE